MPNNPQEERKGLLKKALAYKTNKRTQYLPENEDLALAVLEDKVTLSQAANALYGDPSKLGHGVYVQLFKGIKSAFKNGRIKIN